MSFALRHTLSPIVDNVPNQHRTLEQLDGTPVGDRDKQPKIQLCFELRKKMNGKSKHSNLVLEVAVLQLKNIHKDELGKAKKRKSAESTFVKITMFPTGPIYSTELRMDPQNADKVNVNFMETFAFPLETVDGLNGKIIEVLVCEKKMTRNAKIFGKTEVADLQDIKVDKPVCKWFQLGGGSNAADTKIDKRSLF